MIILNLALPLLRREGRSPEAGSAECVSVSAPAPFLNEPCRLPTVAATVPTVADCRLPAVPVPAAGVVGN